MVERNVRLHVFSFFDTYFVDLIKKNPVFFVTKLSMMHILWST